MKTDNHPHPETKTSATLLFVKEVGRYFMDFLETDFHKRRLPRRSIKLHNDKGLLTAINLNKYPSFYKIAQKLIKKSFDPSVLDRIEKGVYKADIPTSLLNLIKAQINKIDGKMSLAINRELQEAIAQTAVNHGKDYIHAIDVILEDVNKVFKKHTVLNLVKSIENSLISSHLGDENTIFQMEEELSAILTDKIKDKVAELLKRVINKEKVNTQKELKNVLEATGIKETLVKFFEMFKVADLFNELHELYRNYKTGDKQEFYLYLHDISFEKIKYPIFYIPFSLERKADTLFITFDSQLYINKKALSYIAQEYNRTTNKKGVLSGIEERIIYLADHTEDLELLLQELMTAVVNFFELDKKIDVTRTDVQTSKSLLVDVSTNIYIALFDKSDEALVNDYEEMLNTKENSSLMEMFQQLIDDFIHKNPESVEIEVQDDWDDKSTSEQLVYRSPIPLNSEQLKIVSALNKKNCKYVLVEGPPGTGKSHTITAIAFNAILEDQSVLVLSDKKEALDVVEKNIVNTMNKVRMDKKFQNPILRLGKTGNTYAQILTQSAVDGITEQFRAVRRDFDNIKETIKTSLEDLKDDLDGQIELYGKINIENIKEYAELERHFQEVDLCVDLEEAINDSHSPTELSDLRMICSRFNKTPGINKFKFNLNNDVDDSDYSNLVNLLETAEAIKDFSVNNPEVIKGKNIKEEYDIATVYRPDHEILQSYLELIGQALSTIESNRPFLKLLNLSEFNTDNIQEINDFINNLFGLESILQKVKHYAGGSIDSLYLLGRVSENDVQKLQNYIVRVESLKNAIFGFWGKKDKLEILNKQFRKDFSLSTVIQLHKKLKELKQSLDVLNYVCELREEFSSNMIKNSDFVGFVTYLLINEEVFYTQESLTRIRQAFNSAESLSLSSQDWYKKAGIKLLSQINIISGLDEYFDLWDKFLALYEEEKDLIDIKINTSKSTDIYKNLLRIDLDEMLNKLETYKNFVKYILEFKSDIDKINQYLQKYSKSTVVAGIRSDDFKTLCKNKLTDISDLEFEKLIRYIQLQQQLTGYFNQISPLQYGDRIRGIEDIVTTEMTYIMDGRFIDFTQRYKNDAKAIKAVIKSKKKFPKEQFMKLKEAFPCILAGIRDYAEYIPLEPEIFDLVIIDEASQVSIAQAFPALLRAKKVIVLGDNRQFSNVKSTLARTDINQNYLNSLKEIFQKHISTETDKLARLEKFNIKVSILDFFEFINNYKSRLVKHFRGYKELISYSNKFFYGGTLQVMKIRGKPIQEVLKFNILKHDGLEELKRNTNSIEIDSIIEELKKIKEAGAVLTVGIITPHTNQQQLIYEKISQLPESDYYFDTLDLKIMTFDTCQGEERDIVFYSMVATETDDKLGYVFIKNLNSINDEDDGKIKAQRLNVGLSRSKERIHFILSKPIDKFSGEIGRALKHYSETLETAKKEASVDEVDKKSPMEPSVLNWFYQTKFWKENNSRAEIMPQFELGKYLKQLNKAYNHPEYRVDFLLIYKDDDGKDQKIIIEYDGFLEHFGNSERVNAMNYTDYYSEDDVYRQQVLESYGYKFIRLNRFNLGSNPIETLDSQLHEILKKKIFNREVLENIHETIKGLQNQTLKECPRCHEVKPIKSFKDSALITGYGRYCNDCKNRFNYGWRYREYGEDEPEPERTGLFGRDLNKFQSFVDNPEKYATSSEKSKSKIAHLDVLMDQMDNSQLSEYQDAKAVYETALREGRNKPHTNFTRNLEMIKSAINNSNVLKISYKGFTRDIFPYSTDEKYCVAYCTLRKGLRTFRIDRMQDVQIKGNFNKNKTLSSEAEEKLMEAPNYRYQKTYYR